MRNAQCAMHNAQCTMPYQANHYCKPQSHNAHCTVRSAQYEPLLQTRMPYYWITIALLQTTIPPHRPSSTIVSSFLLFFVLLDYQCNFASMLLCFLGILLYSCAIFCPLIMSVLYFNCKATLGTAAFHNAHYHIFYNTTICWVRQTLPHHSVPQNMVWLP